MSLKDDFKTEYAKSNRAKCVKCKQQMDKDSVRIGALTPSKHFDGEIYEWHHVKCFVSKFSARIKSSADVKGIDSLRWEDQQKLKKALGDDVPNAASDDDEDEDEEQDVFVEYAKTGRSSCQNCGESIANKSVRLGLEDPETNYKEWWHVDCFTMPKFIKKATEIDGYSDLKAADKKLVAALIAKGKKEKKKEEKKASVETEEQKAEREKAEKLWKQKDKLRKEYNTAELKRMLRENDQSDRGGLDDLISKCADGILNGAIPRCPVCKKGHLRYEDGKYKCHGYSSAWAKCLSEFPTVDRLPWKIPNYDEEEEEREEEEEENEKSPARSKSPKKRKLEAILPLANEIVTIVGVVPDKADLIQKIEELGGTLVDNVTKKVTRVVTTLAETQKSKKPTKLATAERYSIPISTVEYICDTLYVEFQNGAKKSKTEDEDEEEEEVKEEIIIPKTKQSQPAPDKLFEHREDAFVVGDEDDGFYNAVLTMSDLSVGQRGINSFYCMQVLKHANKAKWYFFIKWGRVGSEGNFRVYEHRSAKSAINDFLVKYLDKTGNEWETRFRFVKHPGRFFPVVIDYGEESKSEEDTSAPISLDLSKKTRLHPKVAQLMALIFDIKMFEQTMKSMDLDIKEMPLGKLGKFQINSGFAVLKEIKKELKKDTPNEGTLRAITNRFYTTIPHTFEGPPPIINTMERLQKKIEDLEVLQNMEVATSILKQKQETPENDPFYEKYQLLKNNVEHLDPSDEMWDIVNKYLQSTCESYKMEIEEIYSLDRHGEADRFSKFNHLPTRKLLWHGTNIAVYAAIMSGGMKIMPHSGGRVGKGLYFADMIGKSACYASRTDDNEALFLLSEVALGKISTLNRDDPSIRKAPTGFDSILATGRIMPDSKDDHVDTKMSLSGHKVIIPQGKVLKTGLKTSFQHNEFLVYDEGQVQLKYLVKVKFQR